ncbi:hypothetical protein [Brevibacterium sp. RIT 803]|uniref:hypothetical protein n=1 Tax=Brevibacterium sp. RIT 803 TaxID=2810210 RepID=UPI00207A9CB5|nr:hypothetical protein [Brevibacterium sp. RIT 803]
MTVAPRRHTIDHVVIGFGSVPVADSAAVVGSSAVVDSSADTDGGFLFVTSRRFFSSMRCVVHSLDAAGTQTIVAAAHVLETQELNGSAQELRA